MGGGCLAGDSGFFAVRDKPSRRDRRFIRDPFYPSLRCFEEEKVPLDALTVLDRPGFDRLLAQAELGAAPNGGPAERRGSSEVGGGPPSVS